MLRQNFGSEPINEQTRISEGEMRQIIELYDRQIGIASQPVTSVSTDSTKEQPTIADVSELLGISSSETQRLLQQAREQRTGQTARVKSKTIPPPPMSSFTTPQMQQGIPAQQVVVQNVIVDTHAANFERFDANDGRYVTTWNWGPFFFGMFWYAYKGMWAKALLYTFLAIFLGFLSMGTGGILFSVALAVLGNYDYYLLRCHGTQMWDRRRQHTMVTHSYQASAGNVPSTFSAPVAQTPPLPAAPTDNLEQMAQKLQLLREAYERELITLQEFEEKRFLLLNEVEHQANLKTLAEAHRLGLLTDAEYALKRQALLRR